MEWKKEKSNKSLAFLFVFFFFSNINLLNNKELQRQQSVPSNVTKHRDESYNSNWLIKNLTRDAISLTSKIFVIGFRKEFSTKENLAPIQEFTSLYQASTGIDSYKSSQNFSNLYITKRYRKFRQKYNKPCRSLPLQSRKTLPLDAFHKEVF